MDRAALAEDARERLGIDEALIERLVRRFYDAVRADAVLGPIFDARIKDWEPHLKRMFAFWSSVVLWTGTYHGQPMRVHAPLPVDARHFDRWLALFEEAAAETCPPAAAAHFMARARQIAESLELGIAATNGKMLRKGERFMREDGAAPAAALADEGAAR
jgi:hemoglobin